MHYRSFLLFLLCPYLLYGQSRLTILTGRVIDEQNAPIEFAQLQIEDPAYATFSNEKGEFRIEIKKQLLDSFTVRVSSIGKRTSVFKLGSPTVKQYLTVKLLQSSLNLDEIVVTETQTAKSSNSSIVFDREAIEQVQAFSLGDILNNLPGKTTIPPSLQNPQNITLRSSANSAEHNLNNALGTSIIMDGLQQSNNANMQARSISKYKLSGAGIKHRSFGNFDVTFGGIDLRDIPADNIESVEVISGVAPAQYGDLTDGAIIINRQAGKTGYQFNSRISGASSNYSLSKGFSLGKKAGALNANFNYLFSNENPSDPIKSYERISGGLMWTINATRKLKNTFSVDYGAKLDNAKKDPDDAAGRMMYSKGRKLALSNRNSLKFDHNVFKSLSFNIGYNYGYQETYSQVNFNRSPEPIADKDTIGIYEAVYTPGNYTSVEHIIGEPESLNANISLVGEVNNGEKNHQLSIGGTMYYAANKGEGIIVDPTIPRWANQGLQNERPYSFEVLPDVVNFGIYLQDNFNFKFFNKTVSVNPGLRYDIQNSKATLQPRINLRYALNKRLKLNFAYGIATKAPTLAHRYPAPTFIDIMLLNDYNGSVLESVALFYTDKIVPDNSNLKASKSQQAEMGLNYTTKAFNTSLFVYYKDSRNGFNSIENFKKYLLPVLASIRNPGARPDVVTTGGFKQYFANYNTVGNNLYSENYGIEWYVNTPKIKSLQTSFSFNTSFAYSSFGSSSPLIRKTSDANINLGKKAWFGIYSSGEQITWTLMSKLNTVTHIPKLGFVVNLMFDIFWDKKNHKKGRDYNPIGYLDKDMTFYSIENFTTSNPDYGHLGLSAEAYAEMSQPFIYSNMSLRVSKEINKAFRFSVNTYNFLNIRHQYENPRTNDIVTLVYPTSLGAELSIKF